ncbi:MAG: SLOG family protein [Ignavibacterium sp.]|nr:SLOG family protein [Ignavibacterium sp.]
MKTICFTGHRPNKLFGYDPYVNGNKKMLLELRKIIEKAIENGYTQFISGMALGIDQWAVKILLALKSKYPHIQIIGAIPCLHQESKWPASSQEEYRSLLEKLDKVVYVTNQPYTSRCMQERNEYMVDKSDLVIAVWDGTKGGTGNCFEYAYKHDKKIIRLHPKTLKVMCYNFK